MKDNANTESSEIYVYEIYANWTIPLGMLVTYYVMLVTIVLIYVFSAYYNSYTKKVLVKRQEALFFDQ